MILEAVGHARQGTSTHRVEAWRPRLVAISIPTGTLDTASDLGRTNRPDIALPMGLPLSTHPVPEISRQR